MCRKKIVFFLHMTNLLLTKLVPFFRVYKTSTLSLSLNTQNNTWPISSRLVSNPEQEMNSASFSHCFLFNHFGALSKNNVIVISHRGSGILTRFVFCEVHPQGI